MTQNCTHTLDSVGSSLQLKKIDQQYLNLRFVVAFRVLVLPAFFSSRFFTSCKIGNFSESKAGGIVVLTDNQKYTM